jgi:hypothetical protein
MVCRVKIPASVEKVDGFNQCLSPQALVVPRKSRVKGITGFNDLETSQIRVFVVYDEEDLKVSRISLNRGRLAGSVSDNLEGLLIQRQQQIFPFWSRNRRFPRMGPATSLH